MNTQVAKKSSQLIQALKATRESVFFPKRDTLTPLVPEGEEINPIAAKRFVNAMSIRFRAQIGL